MLSSEENFSEIISSQLTTDHYHVTSIVNYTNYTRRLIEQEDLDHLGVT